MPAWATQITIAERPSAKRGPGTPAVNATEVRLASSIVERQRYHQRSRGNNGNHDNTEKPNCIGLCSPGTRRQPAVDQGDKKGGDGCESASEGRDEENRPNVNHFIEEHDMSLARRA